MNRGSPYSTLKSANEWVGPSNTTAVSAKSRPRSLSVFSRLAGSKVIRTI